MNVNGSKWRYQWRWATTRLRAGALTVMSAAALAVIAVGCRPDALAVRPDDPTSGVVVVAAWAAWVLAGYLCLAAAACSVAHLRGAPGADRARGRLPAPAALRRLVDAAVGVGVVVSAAGLSPVAAAAAAPSPPPAVTASPLEWPAAPHPPVALLAPTGARGHVWTDGAVVVHAGDSLWSITRQLLGPGATSARIAAEWPRLYAANRPVVGPDPDLIHPGQRLVPPAPQDRSIR